MNGSMVNGRARRFAGGSVVALAAVLGAAPAMAQDRKPAALDEVVVTARKVAENMQDVPVAVTAFSGDDLRRQNAVKVTDVGRMTPGISFRQSSTNPSGLVVSLHGQFQRDVVATLEPSVGAYVDGVYWARSYGLNADLVDLESVQVLKGPQGTLFGRNTTGGAVLLQTNDPKYDRIEGMVSGTFGRFNERALTGVLNMPIITDKVAVRGALQINQRDGYLTDIVTGRKYDDRDNITGRVKLGVKATDNLNLLLSGERFRFRQAGQARAMNFLLPGSLAAIYIAERGPIAGLTGPGFVAFTGMNRDLTAENYGPGQPPAPVTNPPDSQYETETYSGTATLDTGLGVFKLVGAYRGTEGYAVTDLEGSPWFVHQGKGYQDLEQYSGELQLTGKTLGDAVDYVAGAFWFKEDGFDNSISYQLYGNPTSASAAVRSSGAIGTQTLAFVRNKSQGAYGQATWRLTDRLNVTGGLRYSVDNRGIDLSTTTFNAAGGFQSCNLAGLGAVRAGDACTPVVRDARFSNWSYLVSTDYRFTDAVMAYAKFSKGYRSGGQSLRATTAANFIPFGPEIVHEAEIGLKSELFDRRLRFNASAYQNTITGAQRTTLVAQGSGLPSQSVFGNAAKVRVWGVEAQATAVLGGGFKVSASGAVTRPKYLSYRDATGDRSAERFNGVPQTQASLMATYERDLASARLELRADYSWAGKTPLDEFNTPANAFNTQIIAATTRPAGGEANVRGSLAFEDGRYEVAVFGRNIFDNRDLVAALQVIGFGYIGGQYREPATFGVQASYRFGQ